MSHRFADDAPTADIGFVATGATLEECFQSAADATLEAMLVNPDSLLPRQQLPLSVEADSADLALLRLLEELVFYKDARGLFLKASDLRVMPPTDGRGWRVTGNLQGEQIDRQRHELGADVKAVTLHRLSVRRTADGWEAVVVLDV